MNTLVETPSLFNPFAQSGFLVGMVLLILISVSIASWGIACAKFIYLRKLEKLTDDFAKEFSASSSVDTFNRRLADFAYSPLREIFRTSYRELGRCRTRLGQQGEGTNNLGYVLDSIGRAIEKARLLERQQMERFLSLLAISSSVSPYIGLFGTVWGIMGSFSAIARSGNASLAAVGPGISEALVATAFGLAAAIPAVVGYNLANSKIRRILTQADSFGADFLNLVGGQIMQHGLGSGSGESTASKARS